MITDRTVENDFVTSFILGDLDEVFDKFSTIIKFSVLRVDDDIFDMADSSTLMNELVFKKECCCADNFIITFDDANDDSGTLDGFELLIEVVF